MTSRSVSWKSPPSPRADSPSGVGESAERPEREAEAHHPKGTDTTAFLTRSPKRIRSVNEPRSLKTRTIYPSTISRRSAVIECIPKTGSPSALALTARAT